MNTTKQTSNLIKSLTTSWQFKLFGSILIALLPCTPLICQLFNENITPANYCITLCMSSCFLWLGECMQQQVNRENDEKINVLAKEIDKLRDTLTNK